MANGIPQLETRDWHFKNKAQVKGHFIREPSRYVLEEYFNQLPLLNASVAVNSNLNFESLGTNAADADITFAALVGAVELETAGAHNDQVIVTPHLDAKQTAWAGVKWGTENQVIWETAIKTDSAVLTTLLWAGLKLTNTPTIATDNDQLFFRYSTDDSNTNWQCVSSIGGTDTTFDSGVSVTGATVYMFRIEIDSDRKASFFINNKFITATTALTNDVDFIPYVGIQALAGAARFMYLSYEKISRYIYE